MAWRTSWNRRSTPSGTGLLMVPTRAGARAFPRLWPAPRIHRRKAVWIASRACLPREGKRAGRCRRRRRRFPAGRGRVRSSPDGSLRRLTRLRRSTYCRVIPRGFRRSAAKLDRGPRLSMPPPRRTSSCERETSNAILPVRGGGSSIRPHRLPCGVVRALEPGERMGAETSAPGRRASEGRSSIG